MFPRSESRVTFRGESDRSCESLSAPCWEGGGVRESLRRRRESESSKGSNGGSEEEGLKSFCLDISNEEKVSRKVWRGGSVSQKVS